MRSTWILACIAVSFASTAYGCGGAAGGAAAVGGSAAGNAAGHAAAQAAGAVGRGAINPAGHIAMGVGGALVPLGRCIYDEAEVRMADGSQRKVKHLDVGDQVLAFSEEKGVHTSRVVGQLHSDTDTLVSIVEIETSTGRKIPVTPQHSIFTRECLSDKRWSPKSAQEVNVGECMPRFHAEDGDVAEESIVHIRLFDARGIRQPVTETGTIIVDDVVISCYDRVVNQDATHLALLPYRWLVKFSQTYTTHFKSFIPAIINAMGFEMSAF